MKVTQIKDFRNSVVAVPLLIFISIVLFISCKKETKDSYNKLSKEEHYIIVDKGTEAKFSGVYNDHYEEGTYFCKRCNESLFTSEAKFDSKSGWPSFDDYIPGKVKTKNPEAVYSEITCLKCGGHLGHVKSGEKFTKKNKRYCVNSLALHFKKE